MRIIVNADDFGWDGDTVRATIDAFEAGALTSATIMPGMPASESAIEYALTRPQFSFGVHLTFVRYDAERALSPASDIPHLVDRRGRLRAPNVIRFLALTGRIRIEEVERETDRQIRVLRDAGVPVSHVDSHAHVHKLAPFRRAMSRVLARLRIHRIRTVQNVFTRPSYFRPTYWLGSYWARDLRNGFFTTDHFFMPNSEAEWIDPVLGMNLDGTLEVGLHPGYEECWRDRERLAGLRLVAEARARGHRLVTWNDLADRKPGA